MLVNPDTATTEMKAAAFDLLPSFVREGLLAESAIGARPFDPEQMPDLETMLTDLAQMGIHLDEDALFGRSRRASGAALANLVGVLDTLGCPPDAEPDYRDTWSHDGSVVLRLFSHHMSALVGVAEGQGVTPQDVLRGLIDAHLMH